jgi:hypothetical protein
MVRTSRGAFFVCAGIALGGVGCDDRERPPAHPVPTASAVVVEEPLRPGVFRSKRFGLDLELYDGKTWKIDDRSTRWLSATHPEGSSVLVRIWHDENRMSRDKCEERARSLKKLPSQAGSEIVDERTFDVPPGFDTHAGVGLVPSPRGEIFGFVTAFGGLGRRCFAFVYVTQASGPTADQLVAARLAKITEHSLGTMKFHRDFDLVLEREAPPLEEPQR